MHASSTFKRLRYYLWMLIVGNDCERLKWETSSGRAGTSSLWFPSKKKTVIVKGGGGNDLVDDSSHI